MKPPINREMEKLGVLRNPIANMVPAAQDVQIWLAVAAEQSVHHHKRSADALERSAAANKKSAEASRRVAVAQEEVGHFQLMLVIPFMLEKSIVENT